jgi:hypothetical protein
VRVRRTYTQTLDAAPEAVFSLLCPVREVEWVKGWDPLLVVTESGLVEEGCVFVMPDQPADAVWVVTRWDPEEHEVEFVKVTPGLAVGRIHIALESAGAGAQSTAAAVSYEYTALSEAGEEFVGRFTEAHYEAFMKEWESELNQFLRTRT